MRLLLIADRPPHEPIQVLMERERPDAVILLGDLQPHWVMDLRYHTVPKFGVLGNHDAPGYLEAIGATEVGATPVRIGMWYATGMSGCRRYKPAGLGRDLQMDLDEEVAHWAQMPAADLILTHAPPFGINDAVDDICAAAAGDEVDAKRQEANAAVAGESDPAHVGWRGGRSYLARHHPLWWLHGHTYPDEVRWSRQIGNTVIHYAVGSRLVDLRLAPTHRIPDYSPPPIVAAPPATPASRWRRRFNSSTP